jgi:hypothetical protein
MGKQIKSGKHWFETIKKEEVDKLHINQFFPLLAVHSGKSQPFPCDSLIQITPLE